MNQTLASPQPAASPRRAAVLAAAIAVALALLSTAALAAPAARAAVPQNFWGVTPQGAISASQLERLQRGGVDSLRFQLTWVQPSPSSEIDFSGADAAVTALAKAHIEPMPFLYGGPLWAVHQINVPGTGGGTKAPAQVPVSGRAGTGWSKFARAAAERYGPQGSFWSENPELPREPIRTWQIWNEPNFKYFLARPNPAQYGQLVKRSSAAIHAAEPGATVILGGLFARPKEAAFKTSPRQAYNAVEFLDLMYRRNPGIAAKFDGVSLHPYVTEYQRLESEIEEVREELKLRGDAGKKLWITEIGWSSESPRASDSFAVGKQGQARQLTGAFNVLRANQARWRLRQVFWFSVDDQRGSCNFCGGSGLFANGFRPKPAWNAYVRFAGGSAG